MVGMIMLIMMSCRRVGRDEKRCGFVGRSAPTHPYPVCLAQLNDFSLFLRMLSAVADRGEEKKSATTHFPANEGKWLTHTATHVSLHSLASKSPKRPIYNGHSRSFKLIPLYRSSHSVLLRFDARTTRTVHLSLGPR